MGVEVPETRYARSGDVNIAYAVVGDGPFDLVYVGGLLSHLEVTWEDPDRRAFFERLARETRLIRFDKRGVGLSDRVSGVPSFEERMDDVRAVMDAVGLERAALLGLADGGAMACLFAATYPDRTAGLVLYSPMPRFTRAPDFPWRPTEQGFLGAVDDAERRWGTVERARELLKVAAPSVADDEAFVQRWARAARYAAGPGDAMRFGRMNLQIDIRDVLPTIRVPTLVLHRAGDRDIDPAVSRYVAERIPGARYLELPGDDGIIFVGDTEPLHRAVEEFLRETWDAAPIAEPERVLATVLFTDIVGSTAKAVELGDARWRDLLEEHHTRVRRQLARFRGREIDTAGDGFFASFDGPARAVRCACATRDAVRDLGIEIRAGVHTGECELLDEKVAGIAVSIGARVAAQAAPGEVLVSSTVKDLVAGSGLEFEERGAAELKGVPGEWRLYAVRS
jgi:class 3 adenylate cyclase/alpha-beta hydrolase superfamily lysophospholipase